MDVVGGVVAWGHAHDCAPRSTSDPVQIPGVEIRICDVMDIRQLRTFDAVVRHGSFTAAAESLGYTQSAVSQHVAALEASLAVPLFVRRPFGLTPAARRLAEHA